MVYDRPRIANGMPHVLTIDLHFFLIFIGLKRKFCSKVCVIMIMSSQNTLLSAT